MSGIQHALIFGIFLMSIKSVLLLSLCALSAGRCLERDVPAECRVSVVGL